MAMAPIFFEKFGLETSFDSEIFSDRNCSRRCNNVEIVIMKAYNFHCLLNCLLVCFVCQGNYMKKGGKGKTDQDKIEY